MLQGLKPFCLDLDNVAAEAATHKAALEDFHFSLTFCNEMRMLHLHPCGDRPVQLGKVSCEEMIRA